LAGLMLKHRETRGTVIDRGRSRERLRRMSLFRSFCFFDGVTVDVGFGEWSGQLNRGHVLSRIVRSGFFFRELDSEVFGVYSGRRFNFQWLFISLFVQVVLDKFLLVAW